MTTDTSYVSPMLRFKLLILFFCLIVLEVRWQIDLFFVHVPNPYVLLSLLSLLLVVYSCVKAFFNKYKVTALQIAFLLMYTYFVFILLINFKTIYMIDKKIAISEAAIVFINMAIIIITWDKKIYDWLLSNGKKVMFWFTVLAFSPVFFMLLKGGVRRCLTVGFNYRVFTLQYLSELNLSGFFTAYQSLGRNIMLCAFFLFSMQETIKRKIVVCALTWLALYINGGVAAFFAFTFAVCAYTIIAMCRDRNKMKLVIIILMGVLMFIQTINLIINNNELSDSDVEIFKAISEGKNSESFVSRTEIEIKNRHIRKEYFLLGDYKFDLKDGRPGSVSHSLLGIWEYYGLFCFLLYLLLRLYLMVRLLLIKRRNVLSDFALLLMLSSNLLVCFAYMGAGYFDFFAIGIATYVVSNRGNTVDLAEC